MAGGEKLERSNWITKQLYQANENRRRQVSIVKHAGQVFLIEVGVARIVTAELW